MNAPATLLLALAIAVSRAEGAEAAAPAGDEPAQSEPARRPVPHGPLRPGEPMADVAAPPPPPPPVPSPPPDPSPPPERLHLQEPELRAPPSRFSQLCRGPGGSLYILEAVVGGLISGALVAAPAGDSDTTYAGAVAGATLLGLSATLVQYGLYTTVPGSTVDGFAFFGGLAAGGAITSLANVPDRFVTPVVGGAGALALLLALPLHANADITDADALFAIGTSAYATVYTSLLAWFVREQHGKFHGALIGFAPLAGLAVGGLTARAVGLPFDRAFSLVAVPLSVGALVTLIGGIELRFSSPAVPAAALATITVTLVAVGLHQALADSDEAPEADASSPRIVPVLTVVQGRRGAAPAAGLSTRF